MPTTVMIMQTIIMNVITMHAPSVGMRAPNTIMSMLTIIMNMPVTTKSQQAHCNNDHARHNYGIIHGLMIKHTVRMMMPP